MYLQDRTFAVKLDRIRQGHVDKEVKSQKLLVNRIYERFIGVLIQRYVEYVKY